MGCSSSSLQTHTAVRMPNLKLVALRLRSVKNIQKITQSMKMVSAAKFARAEKDLKAARPLGVAAQHFYDQAEVACDKETPKKSPRGHNLRPWPGWWCPLFYLQNYQERDAGEDEGGAGKYEDHLCRG